MGRQESGPDGFDRLSPAVQHHIVNVLGWPALRPLQDQAVEPILDRENVLLIAPTAGGKTEAAVFPLLSRLGTEDWPGVAVLYVCPIKALLNNLEHRLRAYALWIGRTVGLWHGDVSKGQRGKMLEDLPDILLITPESLEVMLTSSTIDQKRLFGSVGALVVDEVHAFAGDDRGWHLMAVADRVEQMSDRPMQRLCLSATVGNPEQMLRWFTAGTGRPGRVIAPAGGAVSTPDVQIDYVGSVGNAAVVISRLHEGEKRLVFTDSRTQAEALTTHLRALGVRAFVTHSSLSVDDRRQAEAAFAEARDCVIVATSILELGIDVGDLDRVIQIDSPHSVASFLQRLGRTGRRAGSLRNCLFLATNRGALIRATALVRLWEAGYVEPIVPPARPYPVLAQQILALCLQPGERGRLTWRGWLPAFLASAGIDEQDCTDLVDGMIRTGYLHEDEGLISPGPVAEKAFGKRHWMALFSVFNSPPMIIVLHGRVVLGSVHELSFPTDAPGPYTLSLGGRNWRVKHLNRYKRTAQVEPSEERGRSRWLGSGDGQGAHFQLCQAARHVMAGERPNAPLSQRARLMLEDIGEEHDWIEPGASTVTVTETGIEWWVFGGGLLHAALASQLNKRVEGEAKWDSFSIRFAKEAGIDEVEHAIQEIRRLPATQLLPPVDKEMIKQMKFAECVPEPMLQKMVADRYSSAPAWAVIAQETLRIIQVFKSDAGA